MKVIRLLVLAGCFLLVTAWPAAADDPPGNNGTVKVDGIEFDTHPDNEPHVGCVFQIDFYGYDEGDLNATATFTLHPPTGSTELLTRNAFIGEDPAGGGTDLDAEITVDLEQSLIDSGIDPHRIQGFHVKLTVHAEGSIGADTKYKVFWVTCNAEYPPRVSEPTGIEGSGDLSASSGQFFAGDNGLLAGLALAAIAALLTTMAITRRVVTSRTKH